MADFLEPVTLKLTSEFDPKGVVEAKKAVDDLQTYTDRKMSEQEGLAKEHGKKTGEEFGTGLDKGSQPGLDDFGRRNSTLLDGLSAKFQKLKAAGDDAGQSMARTTTFTSFLDDEMTKTRRDLEVLAQTLESTGRSDVLVNTIRRTTADLKEMERVSKDLTGILKNVKQEMQPTTNTGTSGGFFSALTKPFTAIVSNFKGIGLQAGDTFQEGFLSGLGQMALSAAPALAPMAAVLVAELFAALNGAVLAGAGFTAIGAGIAAQFNDPQVKGAATGFLSWLKASFSQASTALAAPFEQGLSMLRADLGPVMNSLSGAFSKLAPYLREFAMYLGAAAQQFIPGFTRALEASGPIIGMIGRELPTLANGLNIMFDEMSKGSKGAVEGLDALIKGFAMLLAGTGFAIRAMSDMFDVFVQTLDKGTGLLAKIFGAVPGFGSAMKDIHGYVDGVATSFDKASGAADITGQSWLTAGTDASTAAGGVNALAQSTVTFNNDAMQAKSATFSFKDSVDNLTQSLRANRAGLDENTHAGRQNIETYFQAIQLAQADAQARYASTGSALAAARAYAEDTNNLYASAKAAGATTSQLNALNAQLNAAATYRRGTVDIEVIVHGNTAVIGNQGTYSISGHMAKFERWGGIESFATAGVYNSPPGAGGLVHFAEPETGGEAYIPRFGMPDRSLATLRTAAGWYGMSLVPSGSGAVGSLARATPTTDTASSAGGVVPGPGSGGYVPIVIRLGEKQLATVQAALIPYAQRYKYSSGTTGLT